MFHIFRKVILISGVVGIIDKSANSRGNALVRRRHELSLQQSEERPAIISLVPHFVFFLCRLRGGWPRESDRGNGALMQSVTPTMAFEQIRGTLH